MKNERNMFKARLVAKNIININADIFIVIGKK